MTTRSFLLPILSLLALGLQGQEIKPQSADYSWSRLKLYPAFHFQIGQFNTDFHLPAGSVTPNADLAEIEVYSPEIGFGLNYELGHQSAWYLNLETQFSWVALRQLYVTYDIFGIDPLDSWAATIYTEEIRTRRVHFGFRIGIEKHLGKFVLGLGVGQEYRLYSESVNKFNLSEESLVFHHAYVPDDLDPRSVTQLDEPFMGRTIASGETNSIRSREMYGRRPWTYGSWRLTYFVRPGIGFRLGGNHYLPSSSSEWLDIRSKLYLGFVKAL